MTLTRNTCQDESKTASHRQSDSGWHEVEGCKYQGLSHSYTNEIELRWIKYDVVTVNLNLVYTLSVSHIHQYKNRVFSIIRSCDLIFSKWFQLFHCGQRSLAGILFTLSLWWWQLRRGDTGWGDWWDARGGGWHRKVCIRYSMMAKNWKYLNI